MFLGVDVGDVDANIRELKAHRDKVVHALRDRLETEFGINLDLKHCESLLYQANGEDLLGAIAAARSLIAIEGNIRAVLVKPTEDFSTKGRLKYYGLAVIVRLTIERLTEKLLKNYDDKYLPALTDLANDNNRLRRENGRLLGELKDQPGKRASLEHNIRSLERARDAIEKYRVTLKRKRDAVSRMHKDAARDAKVARSTLQTLEHFANVGDVALRALVETNALAQLDPRDLLPLDDEKLYNDYLDISRQLAVKLGG